MQSNRGLLRKFAYSPALLKKGFFYISLSFLNKSLSVILLPVLTHTLSTEDFGFLTIFSNCLLVLQSVLYFGVVQSFSADYFKEGKIALSKSFMSYIAVPFSISVLCIIGALLFGKSIFEEAGLSYQVLLLLPLIAFSNLLYELLLALLRNEKKEKIFAAATISRTVLEIALVFILVVWLQKNWIGRVYSIFISYLLLGLIAIYVLQKGNFLRGRISFRIMKKEILFGISVIVTQFGFLAISSSDKFFINYFYGQSSTGIYGLSFTIAVINTMVSGALMQFFLPDMYESLASKNNRLPRLFTNYFLVMLVVSLLQVLVIPFFYNLFIGKQFHEGIRYSLIISISSFMWSLSYFCFQILYYFKSKRKLLVTSVILFLIGISVNYFFIKEYYLTGAAIGACVIHLIVLLLLLFYTQQYIFTARKQVAL